MMEKSRSFKDIVMTVFGWVTSIVFGFLAVVGMTDKFDFGSLLFAVCALLFFPPLTQLIKKKMRPHFYAWPIRIVLIAIMITVWATTLPETAPQEKTVKTATAKSITTPEPTPVPVEKAKVEKPSVDAADKAIDFGQAIDVYAYKGEYKYEFRDRVRAAMESNIVAYYKPVLNYDSDLKLKSFLMSPEGSKYKNEFQAVRKKYLSATFKFVLPKPNWDKPLKYDLAKQSFEIRLSHEFISNIDNKNEREIDGFYFPMIQAQKFLFSVVQTEMDLKVPESEALKIEGKICKAYLYFRLNGKVHAFKGATAMGDGRFPVASSAALVIIDKKSGKELLRKKL